MCWSEHGRRNGELHRRKLAILSCGEGKQYVVGAMGHVHPFFRRDIEGCEPSILNRGARRLKHRGDPRIGACAAGNALNFRYDAFASRRAYWRDKNTRHPTRVLVDRFIALSLVERDYYLVGLRCLGGS